MRGMRSRKISAFFGQQLEPALLVAAISGAARLLVHPDGEHHQRGAADVRIIASAQRDRGREHGAVSDVCDHPLGPLARAIDDDDLMRRTAQDGGEQASLADRAGTDDGELHGEPRLPAFAGILVLRCFRGGVVAQV